MKHKIIVTTGTDHTNVYGYIRLYPINPDGTEGDRNRIPATLRWEADANQYPSESHISALDLDEMAKKLDRLGWEVLNERCEPFWD